MPNPTSAKVMCSAGTWTGSLDAGPLAAKTLEVINANNATVNVRFNRYLPR